MFDSCPDSAVPVTGSGLGYGTGLGYGSGSDLGYGTGSDLGYGNGAIGTGIEHVFDASTRL